jgi:uncharacterized protein (DUF2236 family)
MQEGEPYTAPLKRTLTVTIPIRLQLFSKLCFSRPARHINRCHAHVRGTLPIRTGSLAAGTSYDAQDPELKLWVLATLIDSTVLVYDLFIRPLSLVERRDYYQDSRVLAELLGIPQNVMPAAYTDFTTYVESMLASEALAVGDSRTLANALFAPSLMGRFAQAASFVGIGLLPARLREAYGFSWDDKREIRLRRLAELSRRVRRRLPSVICASPRAVFAEWCIPQQRRETARPDIL